MKTQLCLCSSALLGQIGDVKRYQPSVTSRTRGRLDSGFAQARAPE